MITSDRPTSSRVLTIVISGAVAAVALVAGRVVAKQPGVCDGLSGGAFGLCHAYCEARQCDVNPRPGCEQLRKNFQKKTGSSVFPCDCHDVCVTGPPLSPSCDPCAETVCSFFPSCCTTTWDDLCVILATVVCGACQECGNNFVEPGEACDPPGSFCFTPAGGGSCSDDCTACIPSPPVCGNGFVEAGEACDPPGSSCFTGAGEPGICSDDCSTCTANGGASFCVPICSPGDTCSGMTSCLQPCDGGTAGCACVSTIEQTAACVATICTFVPCRSTAECGPNEVCFTEGCCGGITGQPRAAGSTRAWTP